jgi:hypothetical protein
VNKGDRCWMIWTAYERQSFRQAPHGYTVDRRFFQSIKFLGVAFGEAQLESNPFGPKCC